MLQKIKNVILASAFLFNLVPAVVVAAAPVSPDVGVCQGASDLQLGTGANNAPTNNTSNCNAQDQTNKVNSIISTILNILSVIVGVIAVIMIIIGGFRYITSGGSSEKVSSAKNTLLYAIIGLIIVALAQIIVKFVLAKATNPGGVTP